MWASCYINTKHEHSESEEKRERGRRRTDGDVCDGRIGHSLDLAGTELPAARQLLDLAVKLLLGRRDPGQGGTRDRDGTRVRCRPSMQWHRRELTSSEVMLLALRWFSRAKSVGRSETKEAKLQCNGSPCLCND